MNIVRIIYSKLVAIKQVISSRAFILITDRVATVYVNFYKVDPVSAAAAIALIMEKLQEELDKLTNEQE